MHFALKAFSQDVLVRQKSCQGGEKSISFGSYFPIARGQLRILKFYHPERQVFYLFLIWLLTLVALK